MILVEKIEFIPDDKQPNQNAVKTFRKFSGRHMNSLFTLNHRLNLVLRE